VPRAPCFDPREHADHDAEGNDKGQEMRAGNRADRDLRAERAERDDEHHAAKAGQEPVANPGQEHAQVAVQHQKQEHDEQQRRGKRDSVQRDGREIHERREEQCPDRDSQVLVRGEDRGERWRRVLVRRHEERAHRIGEQHRVAEGAQDRELAGC